jgi:ABC-2 type transport system permease protein
VRPRVVLEIAWMTFRDFIRTPEAVFWTYGFPTIMALALGFAFSRGEIPEVKIAVSDVSWSEVGWPQLDPDSDVVWPSVADGSLSFGTPAESMVLILGNTNRDRVTIETASPDEAERRLVRGECDLIVRPTVRDGVTLPDDVAALSGDPDAMLAVSTALDGVLRFDPTRAESDLARNLVELAIDRQRLAALESPGAIPVRAVEPVTEPGSRYIDFLIAGLIGLNLLGSGLFGIGFNLVQMRVNKMLRRLAVTPMRRSEFLVAFLLGRLVLTIPETAATIVLGCLVFNVPMPLEQLPLLTLVVAVGALAFCGLGILIASRARSIEAVSGLMNLAMVPMWILGGCFFSVERFPDVFWPVIACVPMHWLTDATRDVMLSGAGLADVAVPLLVLTGWSVVTFAIAAKLFRWQ